MQNFTKVGRLFLTKITIIVMRNDPTNKLARDWSQ